MFVENEEFIVEWTMPFEAEGPIDAAQQALGIHRDPESIATVFFVTDKLLNRFRIDLNADGSVRSAVNDRTGFPLQ